MKLRICFLSICVVGISFLNCATRGEVRRFKNDIIQIQRQLNSIENTIETRLSSLDKAINEEKQQLEEELDFLRQIRAELNTKISALEEKIQIVDSKLMDAGLAGERRRINVQRSPSIGQPPAQQQTIEDGINAEKYFNNARIDYSKGNYSLAIEGFKEFIRRYPENELVGEAQFWLGDCYFSQGKYLEAINEFEKVLKDHQDTQKVPAALLKLGRSYLNLREYSNVRTYLNELIRKYPESQEARLAQETLDSLPGRR